MRHHTTDSTDQGDTTVIDYSAPFSWLDKHRTRLCTCCAVPRPAVYRWVQKDNGTDYPTHVPGESFHVGDGTLASFTHAHVSGESRDCDGTYQRQHVEVPYPTDDGAREHEWDFWHRMVCLAVSAYTNDGELTISRDEDGVPSAEWSERTDEGWRFVRYSLCGIGSCDLHWRVNRDLRAESMGY